MHEKFEGFGLGIESRRDVVDFRRSETEFLNDLSQFLLEFGQNVSIKDIVVILKERAESLGG